MKAAVYGGPGSLVVKDIAPPAVPPEGVLVKIGGCLLCGTDMKAYYTSNPRVKPGVVLGHELVGRVVEKHPAVTAFEVGDRVTMATSIGCGGCRLCSAGCSNLCPERVCLGTEIPGALAELVAIPGRAVRNGNLIKVPDRVEDRAACLCEPLSTIINAQEIAQVGMGDAVVVVGAGPMGVLHLMVARARGATLTIAVQRSAARRELAARVADFVTSPQQAQPRVMELTGGLGADVVIVTAPDNQAQEQALELLAPNGRLSLFAGVPKDTPTITLDSRAIHYRQLRVVGASDSTPLQVRRALELLAGGRIDLEAVITHRLPLERVVEGIELMKRGESLKVLIDVA